jgi:DNA repair exonuclease SbcCD nuclease subunit
MFKFLHAADLHLGMRTTRFDPEKAARIREARFTALDNMLAHAREQRVDCVLIAGDLFDDAAVDSQTARRAFEKLESLPMPVFVLPGNHDPYFDGGVWDRPPWNGRRCERLRLLDLEKPIEIGAGVVLFPCPVYRKTSVNDPTRWIAQADDSNGSAIRIGVAHGSLMTRDDLHRDDHLIARHAANDLRLDYLALGHWHARQLFDDRDGVKRTAYSGVHETMRFQGSSEIQSGWVPYSGAGRGEFLDRGDGEVLRVSIRSPGDPPTIEPVTVGCLQWNDEVRALNSAEELARLITEVETRDQAERRLLRLKLAGVLDAASMLRLDELRAILTGRYLLGELDESALHIEPTEEEMRNAAGKGVLRRVLENLRQETVSDDPKTRKVAERAILLMYEIAREVGS